MSNRTGKVPSSRLVIDCSQLQNRPGRRLTVRRDLVLDEATSTAADIRDGLVGVDLCVEEAGEGFVVYGRVDGAWSGECRRCLGEVTGNLGVAMREIFVTRPTEGETWPVTDDRVDLTPAIRESAILALPLVPLCSPDCVGPAPDRFPTGPAADSGPDVGPDPGPDPRWAALDDLEFDA